MLNNTIYDSLDRVLAAIEDGQTTLTIKNFNHKPRHWLFCLLARLKIHNRVQSIIFDNIKLDEEETLLFCDFLQKSHAKTLCHLDLSTCYFKIDDISVLVSSLKKNTSLQSLRLSSGQLYFILRYLTDILLENKSLVSLEAILADNNKLHSLQKELGSALQYNLYITELNFISESGEPYKLNNDITHQLNLNKIINNQPVNTTSQLAKEANNKIKELSTLQVNRCRSQAKHTFFSSASNHPQLLKSLAARAIMTNIVIVNQDDSLNLIEEVISACLAAIVNYRQVASGQFGLSFFMCDEIKWENFKISFYGPYGKERAKLCENLLNNSSISIDHKLLIVYAMCSNQSSTILKHHLDKQLNKLASNNQYKSGFGMLKSLVRIRFPDIDRQYDNTDYKIANIVNHINGLTDKKPNLSFMIKQNQLSSL